MADQTYTVEAVTGNEEKPDKGHGPMRSIRMNLAGVGSVEWYTKAATQPPAEGSQITGSVEDSQYGKKFKKARPQNGFGGGGTKDYKADPVKQAAEQMRAAHNTALDYARFLNERGKLDDEFALKDLVRIADFLYARVQKAMEQAK